MTINHIFSDAIQPHVHKTKNMISDSFCSVERNRKRAIKTKRWSLFDGVIKPFYGNNELNWFRILNIKTCKNIDPS